MSAKIEFEIQPFDIPGSVGVVIPQLPRIGHGKGDVMHVSYPIDKLEPSVLAALCDDFRRGVFAVTGKEDPGTVMMKEEPQVELPETPYVLVDVDLLGKLRCRAILPGQGLPKNINNIPKKDEERIMRELELWKADPNRNLERCAPAYRLLEAGEVVREGDEYLSNLDHLWHEVVSTVGHVVIASDVGGYRRRKL